MKFYCLREKITLPPDILKARMAEHSQRTNAKTAIKIADMRVEEVKEFKSKAAARNRKYRGTVQGESS